VSNSRILQIDGVHQVMQSYVGIAPTQTDQQRSKEAQEGVEGISAERAEQQVKPHYIGFQSADCLEKAKRTGGIVERPATFYREAIQFRLSGRHLIRKNGETEKTIAT
jgi:hypothetical protein